MPIITGKPILTSSSAPVWQVKVDAPVKFIERKDTRGMVKNAPESASKIKSAGRDGLTGSDAPPEKIAGKNATNAESAVHRKPSTAPFTENARKGRNGRRAGKSMVPANIPPVRESR